MSDPSSDPSSDPWNGVTSSTPGPGTSQVPTGSEIEAASRQRLLDQLSELGIETSVVDYPAHSTVEEGKALRAQMHMSGTFTKNLFLRDKKNRLFLVSAHEDTAVDLKTLHTRIGAQGRLGFASPELMRDLLAIEPGTVTPMGLMNDTSGVVTCVLEERLLGEEQINFHPMVHTESIGLSPQELLTFLASCDHSPTVVQLD
ncbi:prolyl-tRNA synthetase associated domain-containing protein [Kineococcus sp. SYSU DK002]|uniref:prolyl-tRNA synthetase associated domain-containing protein n=1 Tax=Kineococcus sp. SYSU DK002 TaxID=3383123 RepID=UPI003D7D7C44